MRTPELYAGGCMKRTGAQERESGVVRHEAPQARVAGEEVLQGRLRNDGNKANMEMMLETKRNAM